MYNTMSMPPPWAWGYPPQQPQQNNTPDLGTIREWARMLKEWEKEIKGTDKRPDPKVPKPSVISVALLMLLLSPITGPTMYHFFQLSLRIINK